MQVRVTKDQAELTRLIGFANALPQAVRRAFTLRKVYDLTYPEIAARLNLTVADVESLLTEAVLLWDRRLNPNSAGESSAP